MAAHSTRYGLGSDVAGLSSEKSRGSVPSSTSAGRCTSSVSSLTSFIAAARFLKKLLSRNTRNLSSVALNTERGVALLTHAGCRRRAPLATAATTRLAESSSPSHAAMPGSSSSR
eukprot:216596-Chlamydomonas_euryale.AAC.1